jgi:hypothetical protein
LATEQITAMVQVLGPDDVMLRDHCCQPTAWFRHQEGISKGIQWHLVNTRDRALALRASGMAGTDLRWPGSCN